ncbi:MAG: glycosyltransferase [Bacteroidales bacterium]|jgi:cellulose synthase/poly-beta-1,6-N-acetylglucosamine synthase-like glycosyltransferase
MIFYYFTAIILCISYIFLISLFIYTWLREKGFVSSANNNNTFASIIIPVRNEEENITDCLQSIIEQTYPKDFFEIIVIDDNSTDSTVEKIKAIHSEISIKLIELKGEKSFKKEAILEGIKQAKGELIITTDGDCIAGKLWLETIISFYEKEKPKMIILPVVFHNEKNIFEKIQSLEFLSLTGSAGASALLKNPILCNGANIAYTKEAFFDSTGYIDKYTSGDDMFLMLALKNKFRDKIMFLKSENALIFTNAKKTFSDFYEQRTRWVSKSSGYKDFSVIVIALLIYCFNAFILISAFLSVFSKNIFYSFTMLFAIKILFDYIFIKSVTKFFNKNSLLKYFILAELFYIFYVFFVGLTGNLRTYKWKGRRVKK